MTVDCCSVYVAEPDMRRYRLAATDGLGQIGRRQGPPCRSSRVSSAWWVSVKS